MKGIWKRSKAYMGLITFLMLAGLAVPTGALAVSIGIEPVYQLVGIGSEVTVDLVVSGLGNFEPDSLGAFDVDIVFDNNILTYSGYSLGGLLGEVDTEAFDDSLELIAPDTIDLAEISFLFDFELDMLQPESFTLATITFLAEDFGISPVVISEATLILGDAFGGELVLPDIDNGRVEVAAIPDASTLLLLISAAAMGALGRAERRVRKEPS
jgi:hypothetical protein